LSQGLPVQFIDQAAGSRRDGADEMRAKLRDHRGGYFAQREL
jgi:hypothetical protein